MAVDADGILAGSDLLQDALTIQQLATRMDALGYTWLWRNIGSAATARNLESSQNHGSFATEADAEAEAQSQPSVGSPFSYWNEDLEQMRSVTYRAPADAVTEDSWHPVSGLIVVDARPADARYAKLGLGYLNNDGTGTAGDQAH